jgi:hypothetical protein
MEFYRLSDPAIEPAEHCLPFNKDEDSGVAFLHPVK